MDVSDFLFEWGKILLKLELTKKETKNLLPPYETKVEEKILLQKIGKFWNQQNRWDRPDGLVVLTTHRIVFLSKDKSIFAKTVFLSIPYEFVKDIKRTNIWLITPAIEFNAEDKKLIFTFVNPMDLDELINIVSLSNRDHYSN